MSDNSISASSTKAVIHLHPHFSHLIHSIKLSQRLFDVESFTLLDSPNLQKAYSRDFASYLERYHHILEALFSTRLLFRRVSLHHTLHTVFRRFRTIVQILFGSTPRSLIYATRDSLIRSRFCYLYTLLPRPLSSLVEQLFQIRSKALLYTYLEFLRAEQASLLVVSHSTYSEYVALIEAAATLEIPTLVLSGAIDRAWLIRRPCEIYHITDKIRSLLALKPSELALDLSADSTHLTDSSIYSLATPLSEDPPQSSESCLFVAFHCFKDNNHVANPSRMLFHNYLAWTIYTCLFLALNKSNWKRIVLKIHPHAKMFQDLALFHLLTRIVQHGVNSRKIQILAHDASLSDLSLAINGYNLSVLTFQGSIAYEAVLYGKKPFVVGAAPVPDEACITIATKKQYRNLLSCIKATNLDNATTIQQQQQCRKLISIFEGMKPKLSSREHILSLKDFYFFGSSIPIDENRLRHILDRAYNDYQPTTIPIDSQTSIVLQG